MICAACAKERRREEARQHAATKLAPSVKAVLKEGN